MQVKCYPHANSQQQQQQQHQPQQEASSNSQQQQSSNIGAHAVWPVLYVSAHHRSSPYSVRICAFVILCFHNAVASGRQPMDDGDRLIPCRLHICTDIESIYLRELFVDEQKHRIHMFLCLHFFFLAIHFTRTGF